MRERIKRVAGLVTSFLLVAQAFPARVEAQIAGTETISSIFAVGSQVAGYDGTVQALRFFSPQGGSLQETRSLPVSGNVTGVVPIPNGNAVATGMGRDTPNSPARVTIFTETQSTGRVVFERVGERNQINAICWSGDKLWISFFSSKYITTIGYLTPVDSGPWAFHEVATIRMGDSLGVVGDLVFVGRSYGDLQGQDGDLLLLKSGKRTLLPSYRGVRSLCVVGDVTDHRIFIADGWHMNYGQLAQGRLSVLHKRPEDARYSLQILDYDTTTSDFRRLIPLRSAGRDYIAALGSSSVSIYDQTGTLPKRSLYNQASQGSPMDLALIQLTADKALAVILDQGLRTFKL